jgi:hypothetical protein
MRQPGASGPPQGQKPGPPPKPAEGLSKIKPANAEAAKVVKKMKNSIEIRRQIEAVEARMAEIKAKMEQLRPTSKEAAELRDEFGELASEYFRLFKEMRQ